MTSRKSQLSLFWNTLHMVILPLRCIEPNVLPEIQAMILAGTTSHEEE